MLLILRIWMQMKWLVLLAQPSLQRNLLLIIHAKAGRFFSGTAKELQNELNERAWADTLPRFALRPAAFDAGRYQRFQSFLIESGLLSEAMPIDKIAIDVTAK